MIWGWGVTSWAAKVSEFWNISFLCIGIITTFWKKQRIKLLPFFRQISERDCIHHNQQGLNKRDMHQHDMDAACHLWYARSSMIQSLRIYRVYFSPLIGVKKCITVIIDSSHIKANTEIYLEFMGGQHVSQILAISSGYNPWPISCHQCPSPY